MSHDSLAAPSSPPRNRVVLVDDHAAIREMLALLLRLEGNFDIVGEASGGVEGLRVCRETRPSIVILDLSLPELSGKHLLRVLRSEEWPIRILVFTGSMDEDFMREALALEPDAFVRKEDPLEELREGLRAVAAGRRHISPWSTRVIGSSRERSLSRLSTQEMAVLQMIAEGLQSKQIAEALGTSVKTVDHHRQHLMDKLGLHDVASLTRYAVRNRLVGG